MQLCEYGPPRFAGTDDAHPHLVLDHAVTPEAAGQRERFEAIAQTQRDLQSRHLILSEQDLSLVRKATCGRKPSPSKNESVSKARRRTEAFRFYARVLQDRGPD